jgi:site-specific recombinase XerD
MFPITLSKGLEIVEDITTKGRKRPHWFAGPVRNLIEFLGDVPVRDVTPDDIIAWYDWLRQKPHERQPGKKLSPWTVDSYGRQIRSYFNHLVRAGHLDASPARRLRLPRLPAKGKKEIDEDALERMVRHSEFNPRDHAIVLLLRDSGCRVGELVSMQVGDLLFEEVGDKLRGRAIIFDDKTMTSRYAYFGNDACLALQRYLRVRHHDAPEDLWLTHSGEPISKSGVYQALKRIGKRAGVDHFNPHAFRHAMAKRLVNNGTPHKVIQDLLGHRDITTTLNMYVRYDDDELADQHQRYSGFD